MAERIRHTGHVLHLIETEGTVPKLAADRLEALEATRSTIVAMSCQPSTSGNASPRSSRQRSPHAHRHRKDGGDSVQILARGEVDMAPARLGTLLVFAPVRLYCYGRGRGQTAEDT